MRFFPARFRCEQAALLFIRGMFLARGLTFSRPHPDEGEFLEASFVPLTELAERCLSGEIQDVKTVVAVLKARAMGL